MNTVSRAAGRQSPDLLPTIRAAAQLLTPGELAAPILVGLSGGPDSLALLHLLWRWSAESGVTIRALIVDHALRPESATEAAAVASRCAGWGIGVTVRTVRAGAIAARRGGVEDGARQERYRLLAEEARSIGARTVALGHQANDQAETLLLHLLRGAGLAGLTGMSDVRRAGDLFDQPTTPGMAATGERPAAWRPLLGVARASIEGYCRVWNLAPIHDPTNDDRSLRRNRIRHRLLPLADDLFPGAIATLARSAAILADDESLLTHLAEAAWARCAIVERPLVLLDRTAFRAEHVALQRRLLRRAWREVRGGQQTTGLPAAPIEAARLGIVAPGSGGRWALPREVTTVVERTRVSLGPAGTIEEALRERLGLPLVVPGWTTAPTGETISLGGGWTVRVAPAAVAQSGPLRLLVVPSAIERGAFFRAWRPGDRLHLPTGGTQKLQDWFVDHHVPRYARRHLPLLAVGARVLWIVGVAAFVEPPPRNAAGVLGLTLLYNGAVWRDEGGATRW